MKMKTWVKRWAAADWMKLQTNLWGEPCRFLEQGGKITQAQLNTLFDWHKVVGQKMESWMTE